MSGLGQLPSIDNLQCFLAAAEYLNFRRAAQAMSLTPTAFGQRIKQLEEQLGQTLFERTTRQVELTSAGLRLIPHARETVRHSRRCAEVVHTSASPPARFTVGTRFELGLSWLVPAIIALRQHRPQWHVELYFGSGPDILERLRARHLDCVVTSAPLARKEWEGEFLHPETYVFVAAPSLLAARPFDDVEHARDHTLLDIDESLPLTRYLTSAGPHLTFGDVLLCGAGGSMRQLALEGLGVCVLPEYMIRGDLETKRLVPILDDVTLLSDSFRLLFHRTTPLDRVLREFAQFLRARPLS